ncbi:MAG TPA: hypothetical protein VMM92_00820, partial [Thermoanaerobaculia bacterium]|nr:hypothetical protein [Thermoanaerobaculia bacterium]
MMAKSRLKLSFVLVCTLALAAFLTGTAHAQIAKRTTDTLSSMEFRSDRLQLSEQLEGIDNVQSAIAASTQSAWSTFRLNAPTQWSATVDKRHGLVSFAEGGNIAFVPGKGNNLTLDSIASFLPAGAKKVDLNTMDAITRSFLPKVAGMMGVNPQNLVLNVARSGQPSSHLWFVDYDVVIGGMKVEGARVVFRVNNGNLIQFGTENLPAPGSAVPTAKLSASQALKAASKYIGGFSSSDAFQDNGSLHLVPANIASTRSADGYDFGAGRGLALVYQFVFHRDG